MYQIPLKFIQISPDVAICATRIVAIMSTGSYQARKTLTAERNAGTLINGCGKKTAQSAIFLDNGTVISSPYKVTTLVGRIDKASSKTTRGEPYDRNDIKLYDPTEEEHLEEEELDEEAADEYSALDDIMDELDEDFSYGENETDVDTDDGDQ